MPRQADISCAKHQGQRQAPKCSGPGIFMFRSKMVLCSLHAVLSSGFHENAKQHPADFRKRSQQVAKRLL
jgi:hypothetical protein